MLQPERAEEPLSADLASRMERAIMPDEELGALSHPKLRQFYETQNETIQSMLGEGRTQEPSAAVAADDGAADHLVAAPPSAVSGERASQISFVVNVLLFLGNLTAALLSRSISLYAAAIDSFMDILSTSIILISTLLASKRNVYKFPVGKRRIEPLGIIVFAALMASVSAQLIISSLQELITHSKDDVKQALELAPFLLVLTAILLKVGLFFYCYRIKNISAQTLAQDHRNDIFMNSFSLLMSFLGGKVFWWCDPTGALIVGFLVLRTWIVTAYEQIVSLTGIAADPELVRRITWIALHHSDKIIAVDTVRAFHVGVGVFAEVDIVLHPDTPLRVAHDVGESLQHRVEELEEVERAFCHLDFETDHSVYSEHKVV